MAGPRGWGEYGGTILCSFSLGQQIQVRIEPQNYVPHKLSGNPLHPLVLGSKRPIESI